ncbi:MAG: long-chain-fatty-acid--CoA ligase [Proteobacteria bacterium]|nr:long-chain-fatty-acid--CoA ligase [Pseudomonadota bacterium]
MEVALLVDDFLRRPALLYPDKTAIVDGEKRFTYQDFQNRVNQFSHALIAKGVRKGDRVCMLSPNSHYFLESFYATSQIGAILVPLNYRLTAPEIQYILDHSGVSVVLADPEFSELVDPKRAELPAVNSWILASAEADGEQWQSWDQLIEHMPTSATRPVERGENDIVSINYTSGTTARPKGVMLTHRNCYINAYSFISHLNIAHEDVSLWTLPMFHCNGWGGVYALSGMGATHVVIRTIDGGDIHRLIEEEQVTFACMAPTVLRITLDSAAKAEGGTAKPRFVVAGAPPPAAFIEQLEKELGWRFIQIYGLTETAPILTISTPDHATAESDYTRRSRAGVPAIGVEIRVVDEQGNDVPQDDETVGEICVRSNVVFAGYWKQEDETALAIRDDFFHTGDLGVWDDRFNVRIVDRKKDVIISGGENISSPEVEDALYRHPSVLECAVIGVPDEKWGETPRALIVLRPDTSETEGGIKAFCRENLAHFKCPTSVHFVEVLPRTATGKLQKFKLRD